MNKGNTTSYAKSARTAGGTARVRSVAAVASASTNSSVQQCSVCKECGGSIYGGGLTVEENRTDHRVLTVTAEASKSGVTQTGN